MIAVTFALPAESSAFLSQLRNKSRVDRNGIRVIRGEINNRPIEVLHTGVGEKICRQRLEEFFANQRFDLVLSSGFAGALNDELEVGDLLLARNFSTIQPNAKKSSLSNLPVRVADLLTVATLVDSSDERKKIAHKSGAAAVDMETEFIARACAAHGVPLLSLRIITDTPRESFPAPPKVLFDIEQQRTRATALAKFFLVHPRRIPRLVQFAKRVARARKILASALVAILREL
jgi:adenosylhomocysteine nucleosidase